MPKQAQVLAVIPARSGSKGLPGKNTRPLAGKPLLAWTVEKALKSRHISRVICSTNSEEYAEIARSYGAELPFLRPEALASDTATDIEVMTHAVQWLEQHEGYRPDLVLRLQPTNPTFPLQKIDEGIALLLENKEADSLRPITPSPKHPFKMWKMTRDGGFIEPLFDKTITGFDEPFNRGRQELPPAFVQVGAMEVLRYETLMQKKSMAGDKILSLMIDDPLMTINIDTDLDFLVAEIAMHHILSNSNNSTRV